MDWIGIGGLAIGSIALVVSVVLWLFNPAPIRQRLAQGVLPGKSQQTASDSKAHWANHFCSPSMVIRYCVGRLLKGAMETTVSTLG